MSTNRPRIAKDIIKPAVLTTLPNTGDYEGQEIDYFPDGYAGNLCWRLVWRGQMNSGNGYWVPIGPLPKSIWQTSTGDVTAGTGAIPNMPSYTLPARGYYRLSATGSARITTTGLVDFNVFVSIDGVAVASALATFTETTAWHHTIAYGSEGERLFSSGVQVSLRYSLSGGTWRVGDKRVWHLFITPMFLRNT